MLRFEALQALYGDCFIMQWETAGKPGLMVIDGGPDGVYPILRRRLDALKGQKPALDIDLMMVSHIDDDHINGLLALMRDLRNTQDQNQPLPFDIKRFWFNSFEDVVGAHGHGAPAELAALASNDNALNVWKDAFSDPRSVAVLASVNQGRELRGLIADLGVAGNRPIGGPVIGSANAVRIGGLDVTVVGPMDDQLKALKTAWAKAPKAKVAELADYLDTSTANLSSIVCLVTYRSAGAPDRKILLTGDARGDHALDGLHRYGVIQGNGPLALDLLKVPHHGSDRDVAQDFFEALPAKHYVISANGKYDNPDQATLKWLIAARGTDRYTIHLTNKLPWMDAFFDRQGHGKSFEVEYRGGNHPGDDDVMTIDLDV